MSNSGFTGDLVQLYDRYCQLTHWHMDKAMRSALRAGSRELQRVTKQNLTGVIKKRSTNHKYKDRMEDAVRISKIKGGSGDKELTQSVHIMGTREKGSGTFRARFLEKGTALRAAKTYKNKEGRIVGLKKPRVTGLITPRWYFRRAQESVEPRLTDIYLKEIDKFIDRIYKQNL